MIYRICEVFYSLQGEGLLQGLPMIFVRFSECNLRCSFCDTKYAWEAGAEMDVDTILETIRLHPCRRVCLTGGEPFLQDLTPLVKTLKNGGYWLAVETNGTLWQDVMLDWPAVSPKKDAAHLFPRGYDERFRKTAKEFKYVISDESDLEFIDRGLACSVILQPVDNSPEAAALIADYLQQNPDREWYLRLQLHKILQIK